MTFFPFQIKDESDAFCRLYSMSEMGLLNHLRDLQGERAKKVLDQEGLPISIQGGGAKEEAPPPPPGLDSRLFDPKAIKKPDGMPDIEKLKEIYRSSNG